MNMPINIDKVELPNDSQNRFICKDGKSFVDTNNVDSIHRMRNTNITYVDCNTTNVQGLEYKYLVGSGKSA